MQSSSNIEKLTLDALDLLIKLQTTDIAEAELAEARRWKNKSPEHELAWQKANDFWEELGDVALDRGRTNQHVEPFESNSSSKRFRLGVWASMAASVIVGVGLLWVHLSSRTVAPDIAEKPRTESQAVVKYHGNSFYMPRTNLLDDGSTLILNADSAVQSRMTEKERHIDLLHGEALFKVQHDAKRPFVVETGSTRVKAVGTAFVVKRINEDIQVIVTEGIVEVSQENEIRETNLAPHQTHSFRLGKNESVFITNGIAGQKRNIDSSVVTAWQDGMLIFDDTPLNEVLIQINRYTPYDIRFNLGLRNNEPITGTFFIKELDKQLSALASSLDLKLTTHNSNILEIGLKAPSLK
ncbi:MAG: FecR domain-containing protein [Pseudomonadota bacterium]